MGRGKTANVGDTRTSANGYHYTKTESGWRLTHHLVAEKMLGRPLKQNEMVKFKGSKTNLSENNIEVIPKKTSSLRRRKAMLEDRLQQTQAELDYINEQLRDHES